MFDVVQQALFQSSLIQPSSFWCFVFVTLFNLQGAHRSAAAGIILPHCPAFVKHFFKFFSTLFSVPARLARRRCSRNGSTSYHVSAFLSSTFFDFFKSFFCARRPRRSRVPSSRTASIDYHTPRPLSIGFFKFF